MTDLVHVDRSAAFVSAAEPRDFVALLKTRVMSLVIFTALVGLVRAPGDLHPVLAAAALVCIAAGAGASGWSHDASSRHPAATATPPRDHPDCGGPSPRAGQVIEPTPESAGASPRVARL